MPIVSTDLVLYASATDPDTDSGTAGGAIDALRRFDFTQMTGNDSIDAVSSNAGDTTQTLTVEARKANGTVVSETKTLTGNITVRSTTGPGTNFSRVINAAERGFKMLFRKGASDPSVTVNYYTKGFW